MKQSKGQLIKEFTKGLLKENPIFYQVLGMCPLLAVSTAVENGIWMGISVIFVLLGSNIIISAIRRFIPDRIRIPAFIVVIASFVTIVDLTMHAYLPSMYAKLGIFVPLIVVNCIVLGRAEAFASKNSVLPSIFDGLGMALGFMLALLILGSIREVLGQGSFFNIPIFGEKYKPVILAILPPGAFIILGFWLGILNLLQRKIAKK